MAEEDEILKRGIWKRTATNKLLPLDQTIFDNTVPEFDGQRNSEEIVRNKIQQLIEDAKVVLKRAGLPTDEGSYLKGNDGNYRWIGKTNSETVLEQSKSMQVYKWPYFLKSEPLSIEQFAVSLINQANSFLRVVETSEDKWHFAKIGLHFYEALFKFKLEYLGIAQEVEKSLASQTGRKKAQDQKSKIICERRERVFLLAKTHLENPQNSKKLSKRAVADSVRAMLLSEIGMNQPLSRATIVRDLEHLVLLGRFNCIQTGRLKR